MNFPDQNGASANGALLQDEMLEIVRRIRNGDWEARDQMISGHLHLVREIAQRYRGSGVDVDDLMQEGCLGLMHAVENAEYFTKPFISTARSDIAQAMRSAIKKADRAQRMFSDEAYTYGSSHPQAAPSAGEDCERADVLQRILTLIGRLDPRERTIMRLRFALDGETPSMPANTQNSHRRRMRSVPIAPNILSDDGFSLEEIGERVGLTRARVQQIVRDELLRLRERMQ